VLVLLLEVEFVRVGTLACCFRVGAGVGSGRKEEAKKGVSMVVGSSQAR